MNIKHILFFLGCFLIYPVLGFSMATVTCSFRDSQNVYREFMLERTGINSGMFMDAEKAEGPFWKIMSDDKNKLILFKEIEESSTPKDASVYTIFFIDKKSGGFRVRNYIHTEYMNTVRGKCRFK
jgi:hypothetical protein